MPVRLVALAIAAGLLVQLGVLTRLSPGGLAALQAAGGAGGAGAGAAGPMALFPMGGAGMAAPAARGVVGAIAEPLFTTYLIPFELTSILLLAAAVGAVVLAKRKL
jgi:NADH-quinone oxidoreductase subunit J